MSSSTFLINADNVCGGFGVQLIQLLNSIDTASNAHDAAVAIQSVASTIASVRFRAKSLAEENAPRAVLDEYERGFMRPLSAMAKTAKTLLQMLRSGDAAGYSRTVPLLVKDMKEITSFARQHDLRDCILLDTGDAN